MTERLMIISQRTVIPEFKLTHKVGEAKIVSIAIEAITEGFENRGYLLDWGTLCVHTERTPKTGKLSIEVKMQALDMNEKGETNDNT